MSILKEALELHVKWKGKIDDCDEIEPCEILKLLVKFQLKLNMICQQHIHLE